MVMKKRNSEYTKKPHIVIRDAEEQSLREITSPTLKMIEYNDKQSPFERAAMQLSPQLDTIEIQKIQKQEVIKDLS